MNTLLIQKERIADNLARFKRDTGKTPVIPVISAGGYGVGTAELGKILYNEGVRTFGVTVPEDAILLRREIRDADVILLTPCATEEELSEMVRHDVIVTVGSYDGAVLLNGLCENAGKKLRVHLAFSLRRADFGFCEDQIERAVNVTKFLSSLIVCGVSARVTKDDFFFKKGAEKQRAKIDRILSVLARDEILPEVVYCAADTAAIKAQSLRFDAVLMKDLLMGRSKGRDVKGYKRVGRIISAVSEIRFAKAGDRIGDGKKRLVRDARLALIPACNSVSRGGVGSCEVGKKRAKVVGYLFDNCVIADVSRISCKIGDPASVEIRPESVDSSVGRSIL